MNVSVTRGVSFWFWFSVRVRLRPRTAFGDALARRVRPELFAVRALGVGVVAVEHEDDKAHERPRDPSPEEHARHEQRPPPRVVVSVRPLLGIQQQPQPERADQAGDADEQVEPPRHEIEHRRPRRRHRLAARALVVVVVRVRAAGVGDTARVVRGGLGDRAGSRGDQAGKRPGVRVRPVRAADATCAPRRVGGRGFLIHPQADVARVCVLHGRRHVASLSLAPSRGAGRRAGQRGLGRGRVARVALRVPPTSAAPRQFEFVERQQNASKRFDTRFVSALEGS